MNLEMALKLISYILECVKLSLEFLFSVMFNGEFFLPAFSVYLFFVKNTYQTAAYLMFGLVFPVAMIPVWFLGGQYIHLYNFVDQEL